MNAMEDIWKGKSILIADDDIRNTYALSCYLEEMEPGITILTAANGQEAIELLQSRSDIAIVLMDMMMPGMDGYEATRRIRKGGVMQDIPIIAVTAQAMKGDRDKCLAAGATDYVSKPVDMEILLKRIYDILNPAYKE